MPLDDRFVESRKDGITGIQQIDSVLRRRSLEANSGKRGKELESKVGAPFEHEERYEQPTRRQSDIEEKLDLTKNQAPSQAETVSAGQNEVKNGGTKKLSETERRRRRMRATLKP